MVRKQQKRINKNRKEVKFLMDMKYIIPNDWILMYGCRDGQDVENLLSWNYNVCGYDKYNEGFKEKERYLLDIYVNKIICLDILNGDNKEEIEEAICFLKAYKKENPTVKIYCCAFRGKYSIDDLRNMFDSVEIIPSGLKRITMFRV